ncbi:hypothetical protein P170DRAFT_21444 [Aspergillus steynii IBT 23096]|uniref:Zn(2)-C6 fungal-type domain-containing protein n=1 Tax=Aspergillus steynii IBT 23096 TaxID=1392250 RepID=A0A2I2GP12_9EURO|nr:uncharacterized protein P170DRAFT_21444 [Aspergillus steynii IBT 23096]PLB54612.1 hypothetical protein P170DRAFT_21444 [Aspergillus steynii IBT 23096]
MDKRLSRQACNRCRGLKLRCDRSAAAKDCRRCLAARATCVFNPSTRGRQLIGGKPSLSTCPTRKELEPCNSTEDVSISESLIKGPEVSSDTCMGGLPPCSLCQNVQESSSLNTTALAPIPLTDVAFSNFYSAGETLSKNNRTEMGFPMNPPSPQFADSNVVTPMPDPQTHFQVQFMKDLLALDIELIQHTSTLIVLTEDGPSKAFVDRTLIIAQQMLKILHWVECWASHASYPQTWCLYLPEPLIPSGSGQLEKPIDQASAIHVLSTYLRLLEVYQNLFTRAASNYNPVVANGLPNLFPSFHIQECTVDRLGMQSGLSLQSTMSLLDRLSHTVQLLAMPFIEANVVKAMLATAREHELQMMQNFSQLQTIVYDNGL